MGICPLKSRSNVSHLESSSGPASQGDYMVVSLCDYPSHGHSDQSIHIGERLTVISEGGDFWMVRSTVTGRECYISRDYAAKVRNRWLFTGISRLKAEELLLLPNNHTGAFMVRESQSKKESYSLSVLQRASYSGSDSVKHYLICCLQNGWFYISPGLTFPTLNHLVDHYSDTADGLFCALREPCFIQGSTPVPDVIRPFPITIRRPTLNWREVRSSVFLRRSRTHSDDSFLVSEGLREALSSYLYMTNTSCEDDTTTGTTEETDRS